MSERGYYNRAARSSGGSRKFLVIVPGKCWRCLQPLDGPPHRLCPAPKIHTAK